MRKARKQEDQYFSERLHVKCPVGLISAMERLATSEHTSLSEFVRRALIEKVSTKGESIISGNRDG